MQADYDVILIGYGPVSQTLALMLGRQGRRVAVVERWEQRYPLPRAVCIDHELYRVLHMNGMGDILPSITQPGPLYQWFNAEWKELLSITWSMDSISGGPEVTFVHQPTLEEALDRAVADQPSVAVMLGYEFHAAQQDAEMATVQVEHIATGATKSLTAKFVIGCDGANSKVREIIGSGLTDLGFEADWLVIDVLLKEGVTIETLGIPPAGQYCNPLQPTTIVPAGVRDGRVFRRWEFMRLPGVSNAEMEQETQVWKFLEPWAGPDEVELVRHKVYNFRSLLADKWRDGRLLLAGDAAHVMPPFMGQGMCSGMRDTWNLAWKLALILDGKAEPDLLDTYQAERAPHVRKLMDMSIFLGKIICIPDPEEAARRDAAFANGTHPPFPSFPVLTGGLLYQQTNADSPSGVGQLLPHVTIAENGKRGRFDQITGGGFILLSRNGCAATVLSPEQRQALAPIGLHEVALATGAEHPGLTDVDGRLLGLLDGMGWDAVIVRPDFYIYGGSTTAALADLVDAFIADLDAVGVRIQPITAARLG